MLTHCLSTQNTINYYDKNYCVQVVGLEPTRLTAPDPKSGLSTNFNTPAS